jgi:hypothetical protein
MQTKSHHSCENKEAILRLIDQLGELCPLIVHLDLLIHLCPAPHQNHHDKYYQAHPSNQRNYDINSVPAHHGENSAGTIKADEWYILSMVYLPIALVNL